MDNAYLTKYKTKQLSRCIHHLLTEEFSFTTQEEMKRAAVLGFLIASAFAGWWFSMGQNKESLHFAVLSDLHFSLTGEDQGLKMLATGRKTLPEVLEELNQRADLDFVIFIGDLLVDPQRAELEAIQKLVEGKLKKPFYVIPGNHDRKMKEGATDAVTPSDFVSTFEGHPYPANSPA